MHGDCGGNASDRYLRAACSPFGYFREYLHIQLQFASKTGLLKGRRICQNRPTVFQVEAKVFCHSDVTLIIPITIGSYPLTDDPPDYEATVSLPHNPSNAANRTPAPYPENDPPTYEEAIRLESNNKYIPRYPVYRRATSYSSNNG